MALNKSDKLEIERISRAEIKDFLKKATFKNTIIDLVEKELNSNSGKLARTHKKKVAAISTKVLVELYKVFWLRRSFWENQIKNVQ
tara:strand:+ start:2650 stop:2907 length:258 start_codon:yes stop_codon:yes gene_type:complete